MKRVDVVVPCYNYARFLDQCVNSVLDQAGVDVRVLILDDASKDDTPRVGQALAQADRRVVFRRHESNKGHIATYNEGLLEWASGEFCLLLSADDMLAPGALRRATDVMNRHPEVGMTYGLAQTIFDNQSPSDLPRGDSTDYQVIGGADFLRQSFAHGNGVPTPTAVIRTELQQRVGGYRADLPHSGDMEMWMRFAVHGPIGVVRSIQAYARKHGENMSYQYYGQLLSDCREVIHACDHILSKWGTQFSSAPEWREAMAKRICRDACFAAARASSAGDAAGVRTCLEFARSVYPQVYRSPYWWRVQARRLVGPAGWQALRRVSALLSGRHTDSREAATIQSRVALTVGRWPEGNQWHLLPRLNEDRDAPNLLELSSQNGR